PFPFVPSARPLPAAARITARPTTRIFVILTFLIRQHRPVIYSTPLPTIPLDHYSSGGKRFSASGRSSLHAVGSAPEARLVITWGSELLRARLSFGVLGPIVNER